MKASPSSKFENLSIYGPPLILTPQAIEDLGGIVRRIATDSPDRARSFGHALLDAALAIDPAVREVLHGDYRIIYEVQRNPDAVYVLRFWHGARGTPHLPPT